MIKGTCPVATEVNTKFSQGEKLVIRLLVFTKDETKFHETELSLKLGK